MISSESIIGQASDRLNQADGKSCLKCETVIAPSQRRKTFCRKATKTHPTPVWGFRHALCDGADLVATRERKADADSKRQKAASARRAEYTHSSPVRLTRPDGTVEMFPAYPRDEVDRIVTEYFRDNKATAM